MSDARGGFRQAVAVLPPGYFALVMATGIVAIAGQLLGHPVIARGLLVFNVAAYLTLWALMVARLVFYPARVWADLTDHSRGPGFFTLVAGTNVLGSQLIVVAHAARLALALWLFGVGLWVVVMYGFLAAITLRAEKPTLPAGINGTWLIVTVATQSVTVLGVLLVTQSAFVPVDSRPPLLFFALCMYLLGCMLYLIVITLIFYRFTFFALDMTTLTPPYWINMGAVAITTLAGALLVLAGPQWAVLLDLQPFLKGFTLFFWATATWWIPLLVIFGVWRHGYRRFPLRYDPQYWGMVFPLGMYTVSTIRLSEAISVPFLLAIPAVFFYIALAAWLATFVGWGIHLARSLPAARERPPVTP